MIDSVRMLNERIARTRVNSRGYRQYEEKLRRDICSHAFNRLRQGGSYKDIAEELGLAATTLQNWFRDVNIEPEKPVRPMGFRPVEVTSECQDLHEPAPASHTLEPLSRPVVVLPNGMRIEGLSVTDLPRLLKELV